MKWARESINLWMMEQGHTMFHLICKTKIQSTLRFLFLRCIYEWWWMSYINPCAPIPHHLQYLHFHHLFPYNKALCNSLPFELHGAPKMHVTLISFLLNTRTLILWCPLHAINTGRYQCWHIMCISDLNFKKIY